MATMVSTVIKTVLTDQSKIKMKSKKTEMNDISLESQSLQDLMLLIDKHYNHPKFLKDNDLSSEERNKAIVEKIDVVFQ